MKFLQKLFGKRPEELKMSYEEKRYSLGVKVLVVFLTFIVWMLGARAIDDLQSGIPRVPYPNYRNIAEWQTANDYQRNTLSHIRNRKRELESKLHVQEDAYDSSLLEQIAGEDDRLFGTDEQIRGDVNAMRQELTALNVQLADAQKEYDRLSKLARDAEKPLRREYEKKVRVRQLKVFFWEALFWVPFFAFALWWNTRSKRKESRWEVVSLAALIAASLLSLQSICVFLWSWIPKEFLEWLWEILSATLFTRIVGYYIMLGLVILLLGGLTVWVHRRMTDPARGGAKKIRHGLCPICSYPLNLSGKYCGGCGKQIKKNCSVCNAEVFTWSAACTACGSQEY